uniref:Organic cation transporter protein n=2 Tax=Lygus hesperus TaxID=30085 RepID=A0A146LK24_LYGHE
MGDSDGDSGSNMTATGVVDNPEKRRSDGGHREAGGSDPETDVVTKCVGDFGRWQLLITFILSMVNFPCTFHIFAPTFLAGTTPFWCARPQRLINLTAQEWINLSHVYDGKEYDRCRIKDLDYEHASMADLIRLSEEVVSSTKCKQWEYDETEYGRTIISEWDLVCDRTSMVNFAEMAFLAGVAVGGLASGFISDRFGRKRTLMMSIMATIVIGMAVAFSPCYWVYVLTRCFLGFFSVSIVLCGFVLCIELVGGKWVTISGVSYLFTIPLGYITIAGISYWIKGWRELQITITLTAVVFPLLSWLFKESPRWLITMKDGDRALQVMREIAEFNKKDLPPNADKLVKQAIMDGDNHAPAVGLKDLFNTPEIRKVSFVMYSIWFTVYFVYYGLVLNVSKWGGNVYADSVISAAVELPAIGLSILILLKMGRRLPLCIATVLAGVACLLTIFVKSDGGGDDGWKFLTLATFARFCISSSNVVMPVFTAEKFPTAMRNLGVGSSNAPAGIALLSIPYLWNIASMLKVDPMAILGVCSILGGLSVLILPESSHL